MGAQYLGEEVGHVGRLELIRRQVHDAAGDRCDRSAHPQVAPAIGRQRDDARPPEEPPLVDDDRFALRGEPVRRQEGGCGAHRASGGDVLDRAGQFTRSCDAVLASAGIEAVKILYRSPRAKRLRRKVRPHRPDRGHRPNADLR